MKRSQMPKHGGNIAKESQGLKTSLGGSSGQKWG
eukprot:CAMPEP_0206557348 /NCGR_PEP_ID=MMETSP0325_2-20121206/19018_1 /ASSEMBLY_ACC=CAM_ASM_000347 /TAXON_ID=2866 /ORGANISM="Crypthecodinium cohnii, Strain Seligo" /LENGTH=33 /DNA_ID= /DNA_START= /DNA_END= /DNA_ORIENTATION=